MRERVVGKVEEEAHADQIRDEQRSGLPSNGVAVGKGDEVWRDYQAHRDANHEDILKRHRDSVRGDASNAKDVRWSDGDEAAPQAPAGGEVRPEEVGLK